MRRGDRNGPIRGENVEERERYLEAYRARVAEDAARRVEWIRELVDKSGARGVVLGLSGGLDSAVVAALVRQAVGKERLACLVLPIESPPESLAHARLVAEALDLNVREVDLGPAFAAFRSACEPVLTWDERSAGNLKARLRMAALYAYANAHGCLVAGTSNRSELYVGYSTKGGDAVADFFPIASLTKSEVRVLAEHLGIPPDILQKPPSADLWPGQTDEGELGLTYAELDRYLLTGEAPPGVRERIEALHRASEHKRELPPSL
ncbi:MAG: NAD synthetase [Brockia lithotrophica]|uniref:NH(3)-dependent NAD(+) synthetase n=1 Tax=Brockia lithotrophica TaxID=933949 RepID=A0A2T5G771_9BACL|nr:MAG: NAD synthetase [Brockia lithotrophica]